MGSLLSAPVFPADRHTMTEQPTTRAISRQSTSESVLKRHRRATSTSRAAPAVMAAVSAMCANGKTEGLVDILFFSSSLLLLCGLFTPGLVHWRTAHRGRHRRAVLVPGRPDHSD